MCNSCGKKWNRQPKRIKGSNKKKDKCPEKKDENTEPPKCPKKKRFSNKPKKCLTKIEKIMMRIQPSIADRERYLHPEHVNCFLEASEILSIKKQRACGFYPSQRPKVCAEDASILDKKNKKKKNSDRGVEDREKNDGKTEEKEMDEEKDVGSDTVEQKAEEDEKSKRGEEKLDQKEAKQQIRTNKKDKKQRKRRTKNIEEDSDSEMSICSIDSEVCLVGLALTKEDKKTIEENRRKVHPPPTNENQTVEKDNNVPDAMELDDDRTGTEESRKEDE